LAVLSSLVALSFSRRHRLLHSFPTRRSSDLVLFFCVAPGKGCNGVIIFGIRDCRQHGHSLLSTRTEIIEFTNVFRQFRNIVGLRDRKSTRLNSSHVSISYAVFCLKKKR